MKIQTANMARMELHNLIGDAIAPLPVALISTIGQDGTFNAAPFSFIAPVCSKPPVICVSFGLRLGQKKDTVRNIEFSHDFVVNTVDETMLQQAVNASGDYPAEVDEIKLVGLTAVSSETVKSPRIAEAKVSLECQLVQKLEMVEELPEGPALRAVIFGKVVMAHVSDEVWVGGKIDPSRLRAVGRVSGDLYCKAGDVVEVKRPSV